MIGASRQKIADGFDRLGLGGVDDVGRAESLAASSRFGWMSMTTIRDAPAMRAPLTALSPTPPAPKITTVSPALTFAVFKTAPRR